MSAVNCSAMLCGLWKEDVSFFSADEMKCMDEFDRIWNFQNLYKAHKKARKGKQDQSEVISFEMDLAFHLTRLSEALRTGTYQIKGYYSFYVHDPKERKIHALRYEDRVVQHCICDEVLGPAIEKKLIYDNAACRKNKGTLFALKRLNHFLVDYHGKYGTEGYFLKFDIRKFFDSIDHDVLKAKLSSVFKDERILDLLERIIDSYHTVPGKGLPMGNQTSQWFAVYYLDTLDRLIKEKLSIRYYTRYMDDGVLIHHDKEYLKQCLRQMEECTGYLQLSFNDKTQISSLRNGIKYLGFHYYLTCTGKVIRKISRSTAVRYKHKLSMIQKLYKEGIIGMEEVDQVLMSYKGHLSYGHTYKLKKKMNQSFVLIRG